MKSRIPIVAFGLLLALAAGGLWLAIGGSKGSASRTPVLDTRSATPSSPPLDLAPLGSVSSATTPPERAAIVANSSSPGPQQDLVSGITRGTLSGRLLFPDGSPAPDVAAALFADTHVEVRRPLAETRTAADGTFMVTLDAAPVLLVAVTDGFPPLALSTQVVAGTDTRLADASFAVGAHIRGTWKMLGRPVPAGSNLTVNLFQVSGVRLKLDDHDLVESGGDVVERIHRARTDDAGQFRIEGIEPGLYRVMLTPNEMGGRLTQAPLEVRASIDDWSLDFDDARIILRIELDGAPVEAEVLLTEGAGHSGSSWGSSGSSTLDVFVPPGMEYDVEVKREGCPYRKFEITAPPPRQTLEQTVVLERLPGLAEIVVDIVMEDHVPVPRAGIALFREGDVPLEFSSFHRLRADGQEPSVVRDLTSVDGWYRLTEIPPGRYEVRVEPGSSWDDGWGYWRHDPAVVDLPPGGHERTQIVLRAGGRLRLRALDGLGASLGARCRLVDPAGESVPLGFRTRSGHSVWGSTGALNPSTPDGWNLTCDPLPLGSYELLFSMEGRREATRRVEVEAGRTTDVEVVLEEL